MKTNASEYILVAIFLIMIEEKEVHLVTFHSHTFKTTELNYDMHDKELLTVFKVFYIWHHYLEGLVLPIDIMTDYRNLEYFLTTKILSHHQARYLEFLSQFNLIIYFHLRCLESKLDAITHREDLYSKEERAVYNSVSLQNIHPVFTYNQL